MVGQYSRKIVVDRNSNTEKWKVVKGFWDVSSEDNGNSGCGVVIKGLDRDKTGHDREDCGTFESWCGYMTAEVMVVCVLTENPSSGFQQVLVYLECQSVH